MTATQFRARLHWLGWLTPERLTALPNSRQGFTARLAHGGPDVTFSVILTFGGDANAATGTTDANLELLAPVTGVVGEGFAERQLGGRKQAGVIDQAREQGFESGDHEQHPQRRTRHCTPP